MENSTMKVHIDCSMTVLQDRES